MSNLLFLLFAAMLMAPSGAIAADRTGTAGFDYQGKMGVVYADDNGVPLIEIQSGNHKTGDVVSIVVFGWERGQRLLKATIAGKSTKDVTRARTAAPSSQTPAIFELRLQDKTNLETIGIGVIGESVELKGEGDVVAGDLDSDGVSEFFRECASHEGLHLTVWSGKPLEGQKRWHAYYYLGYDVDPDCSEKDYSD